LLSVANQVLSVAEHSPAGTTIGSVAVSYTGSGTLNYQITQGNELSIFSIHPSTGVLSVANSSLLDFETTPLVALTVRVTDGTLVSTATLTVTLENINEVTGIDEAFRDIKIYPNPVENTLVIDWPSFRSAEIHDLSGRLMMHSSKPIIDMTSFASGLYILIIEGTDFRHHRVKVIRK
jgi:hypothetical protein